MFLRFTADKFSLDPEEEHRELTEADIEALPRSRKSTLEHSAPDYDAVQKASAGATGSRRRRLRFAAKAWRRPLTETEKDRLRSFYVKATESGKLDHGRAIEALLARVLISPAFLYRLEQPAQESDSEAAIELGTREPV